MNKQKQEIIDQLRTSHRNDVRRLYPRGSYLFRAGDTPRGVFYLQEGTVELSNQKATRSRVLKEQIVGGEVVGLTELFTGKKYKTSARCRSLAHVIFVSKEHLFQ